MAYTKIHAIKTTLGKALSYIENPEKTEEQLLVTGYNVDPLMASVEYEMTAALARDLKGNYTRSGGANNLAYHLIQSFSPSDDVTPEQAHEIGKQLADQLLGGRFEYVISTHVDKEHIHNHIIFNAVSFYDFKKFRTKPFVTAAQIRAISDNLCAQNDLSVIRKGAKLGYSHSKYEQRKKNSGWKSEIRRRLSFILKAATDYNSFIAAAAQLGVTVDDSGKEIKYSCNERQDEWIGGEKLSDTDAFQIDTIRKKLQANAETQRYIRTSIEAAAASSTDYDVFLEQLKSEYGVSVVRRKRKTFYKLDDMDGSQIEETILGSAYTTSAIQSAIAGGSPSSAENTPYSIIDAFASTARTKAEGIETPIVLPEQLICKVTTDGVALHIPQCGAQIFIGSSHIDLDEQTGTYTAWLGSNYDYFLVNESGILSDKCMKGEQLIRAIDQYSGSTPVQITLMPEDVASIGEKGVTLHIPELGINRLFLDREYVTLDRMGGGSCKVDLYHNWNYSFRAEEGNELRGVSGAQLIAKLQSRDASPAGKLAGRITAYNRRSTLADAKELAAILRLLRAEQIGKSADIDVCIDALSKKSEAISEQVKQIEQKNEQYKAAAKYLTAYHRNLPILEESASLHGKEKRSFDALHDGELTALYHAVRQLEKMHVEPYVDPDKVKALIKNQNEQVMRLREQANEVASRIAQFRTAQRVVDAVQQEEKAATPQRKKALKPEKNL